MLKNSCIINTDSITFWTKARQLQENQGEAIKKKKKKTLNLLAEQESPPSHLHRFFFLAWNHRGHPREQNHLLTPPLLPHHPPAPKRPLPPSLSQIVTSPHIASFLSFVSASKLTYQKAKTSLPQKLS